MKNALIGVAIGVGVAGGGGLARAGYICEQMDRGAVEVDGGLDEWKGLTPLQRGGGDRASSYEIHCGYDGDRLYLAVDVHDDRVIRTGHAGESSDDSFLVSLGADPARPPWRLRFFPATRGFPAKKVGGGSGLKIEDTLTDDGWRMEAAIPLSQIPGWGAATPMMKGELSYHDVDGKAGAGGDLRFRGSLHFAAAVPALRTFLATVHMGVKDFKLDTLADVDAGAGNERVMAGGKVVGVLSDEFAFLELPVQTAADVVGVQLVDFAGDGHPRIVTDVRQAGGGGAREVVTVWKPAGEGRFEPLLAFEVGLDLGGRRLANHWSIVPAGSRRAPEHGKKAPPARGKEIVVEVGPGDAGGWDQQSFAQVAPSPDAKAPLLPWTGRKAVVYAFDGDTLLEADAKPPR